MENQKKDRTYAIGLDFGTLSVRALLLDLETGEEAAVSVYEYPHGVMETKLQTFVESVPPQDLPPGFALQHPQDYLDGMTAVVRGVLEQAEILPEQIVGIGVDFTSSTILPVRSDGTPLCLLPEFAGEPHAYVKLWKHHGGEAQAQEIDRKLREYAPKLHALYGGKVSGEWMVPKVLETLQCAPAVYRTADRFLEALDWVTWMLTGEEIQTECTAGYKSFYHHETGFLPKEFWVSLHPEMVDFIEKKLTVCAQRGEYRKLTKLKTIGETAGVLSEKAAEILGLHPGTPVASGIIDAHASVLGSGIAEPGTLMVIVGTSSCHLTLSETEAGIPGVGGLVRNGILPGYFGYEAGQCCVGDHYAWFAEHCVPESYAQEAKEKGIGLHQLLTEKLEGYRAGQSGLLALDWFNGVRSPLMDFDLNGLILGLNLQTRPEEIYRALIEATAYGTRMILEAFEAAGTKVDSIVLGGGIPVKNPMLVQIYADVCKRRIRISGSQNASARGAAILGAAAAQPAEAESGMESRCGTSVNRESENPVQTLTKRYGVIREEIYQPDPENGAVYDQLYQEYVRLCDYFGRGENDVMKRLNALRGKKP